MADLRVDWNQMQLCADSFSNCQTALKRCIDTVTQTKNHLQWQLRIQMDITAGLNRSVRRMETLQNSMRQMSAVLQKSAEDYRRTEIQIATGQSNPMIGCMFLPEIFETLGSSAGSFSGGGGFGGGGGGAGIRGGTDGSNLWSGALFTGGVAVGSSLFGLQTSGGASYELFGGSVDTVGKATWKIEEGELNAKCGITAGGHAVQGTIEGSVGNRTGSLTGEFLTGSVTGAIGVGLMRDGVFAPSLQGEVKAEGSVLHGEAKYQNGTEDFNVHTNAEGSILTGEVGAKGGIGVITEELPDGRVETYYGVEGKVSAEGYVFQGEVSTGFTLFGIKVDASIEGNALGAGFEAGGKITANGASGKIGAGLGVGGGVEISVDWSDFEWPDFSDFRLPDWNAADIPVIGWFFS